MRIGDFNYMKKTFILYSFFFILAVTPALVSAATMPDIFPGGYWADPYGTPPRGLLYCSPDGCTFDDLIQTFLNFVAFGITLALFIATPILFAWGGIMIMLAGGSPEKLGQGKKILTGTLIGVLIVLASFLILRTFINFLGIAGIGGFS